MSKPFKTHLVCVALLACLAFPGSLWLSRDQLGSRIDFHHGWLTAHALLSLTAYRDFGFLELAGLSCVVPKSPEWETADFGEKIKLYVSFPMLHLMAPYGAWKLASLAAPVELDFPFLQTYHLLANRLLALVALYFALFALLRALLPDRLSPAERAAIAACGAASWLFTPGTLFFTQNVSFSDMAVFTPVFAYMAVLVGADFGARPKRRTGLWLAVTAFAACGMDWYGYVVCGLGALAAAAFQPTRPAEPGPGAAWRRRLASAWRAAWPTLAGMSLATGLYVLQLLARGNRFLLLWDRLLHRTKGAAHQLKPPMELFADIFTHFKMYLPWFFRDMSPYAAGATVILAPLALFLPAWFLARRTPDARARLRVLQCWVLFWLPPLAHILILRPHSAIHDFSALKIALLPALGAMGVACLAAMTATRPAARAAAITLAMAVHFTVMGWSLPSRYRDFVGHFDHLITYGEYFRDNFAPDQILVSGDFQLLAYPNGDNDAVTAWYAKRCVFPPWTFCEYRDQGLLRGADRPQYLFAAQGASSRDWDSCDHIAAELPKPVDGRTALACTPDVERLCLAARLDEIQAPPLPDGPFAIDLLAEPADRRVAASGLFELEQSQGKPFRWASGHGVELVFEAPAPGQLVLGFDAESFIPGQTVHVAVNGTPAWSVPADPQGAPQSPRSRHQLEFPARQGVNRLELTFDDYNGKTRHYVPSDSRPLAAALGELTLSSQR